MRSPDSCAPHPLEVGITSEGWLAEVPVPTKNGGCNQLIRAAVLGETVDPADLLQADFLPLGGAPSEPGIQEDAGPRSDWGVSGGF